MTDDYIMYIIDPTGLKGSIKIDKYESNHHTNFILPKTIFKDVYTCDLDCL